jgi:O-antigen/teichoic acid export membrane protein
MRLWQALNRLQRKLQTPGMYSTIARGAATALTIQILSIGINYGVNVLLARWLGVRDYGVFQYVSTISLVLAFVAGFGVSGAVLRFIPEYTVKQDWKHLRGILQSSWMQTLAIGTSISGCLTIGVLWQKNLFGVETASLLLGIWGVPLLALLRLQQEVARAFRQITLAFIPFQIAFPVVLIGVSFCWIKVHHSLNSAAVLSFSVGILSIILIINFLSLIRYFPKEIRNINSSTKLRQWLAVSLPILFLDGSSIVLNQTDTLLIGSLLEPKFVGIYNAASQTSSVVSIILVAVNAIAAPEFASLYAQGDISGLQRLTSTIARWMFGPTLLLAGGLILFSDPILNLFGVEFVVGKWAMIALVLGQLVNVGAGSVGYLLIMTGHQNQCARVMGICALVNVILNSIAIPTLGIFGAGLATGLSVALWNIWLCRLVVKYLNVNPSITAALRG